MAQLAFLEAHSGGRARKSIPIALRELLSFCGVRSRPRSDCDLADYESPAAPDLTQLFVQPKRNRGSAEERADRT
jgi:hypothetical protein